MTSSDRGTDKIEALIQQYSWGLDRNYGASTSPSTSAPVVLLTGSTGNLGAQVLSALLQDDRVERVYALNWHTEDSESIQELQLARFKEIGLDPALLESEKLVLLLGDLTQPNLSLDRGKYGMLCGSVNVVIHSAWRVNSDVELGAFEPHIQGTRHLIDLLKSGPNASTARFVFTSSVSAVQGWDKSRGAVPEEVLTDASVALGGSGYGEAKYVCERILAKSGLTTTSVRIGQISGGHPKSAWATTDWVPILVKSSVALGVLPQVEGNVSWVPADAAASALVDVALGSTAPPAALNLVHPNPVEWNTVVAGVRTAIKEVLGRELELVPFDQWLTKVDARGADATAETLADIPAIKLLDWLQKASQRATAADEFGVVASKFTTDKTQSASDAVARLSQIGSDDVRLWVEYWYSVGFIRGL